MFFTIAQITYTHLESWGQKIFGETESLNNPFAFNNYELWEKAIEYLEIYIDKQVTNILEGKQLLIYTNQEEFPFRRIDESQESILAGIIANLEQDLEQNLSPMDKAYISCKFYNDVEQAILEEVTIRGIFAKNRYSLLLKKIFVKKLKYMLKEGQEIAMSDLREMYSAYTGSGLWKYYYLG